MMDTVGFYVTGVSGELIVFLLSALAVRFLKNDILDIIDRIFAHRKKNSN